MATRTAQRVVLPADMVPSKGTAGAQNDPVQRIAAALSKMSSGRTAQSATRTPQAVARPPQTGTRLPQANKRPPEIQRPPPPPLVDAAGDMVGPVRFRYSGSFRLDSDTASPPRIVHKRLPDPVRPLDQRDLDQYSKPGDHEGPRHRFRVRMSFEDNEDAAAGGGRVELHLIELLSSTDGEAVAAKLENDFSPLLNAIVRDIVGEIRACRSREPQRTLRGTVSGAGPVPQPPGALKRSLCGHCSNAAGQQRVRFTAGPQSQPRPAGAKQQVRFDPVVQTSSPTRGRPHTTSAGPQGRSKLDRTVSYRGSQSCPPEARQQTPVRNGFQTCPDCTRPKVSQPIVRLHADPEVIQTQGVERGLQADQRDDCEPQASDRRQQAVQQSRLPTRLPNERRNTALQTAAVGTTPEVQRQPPAHDNVPTSQLRTRPCGDVGDSRLPVTDFQRQLRPRCADSTVKEPSVPKTQPSSPAENPNVCSTGVVVEVAVDDSDDPNEAESTYRLDRSRGSGRDNRHAPQRTKETEARKRSTSREPSEAERRPEAQRPSDAKDREREVDQKAPDSKNRIVAQRPPDGKNRATSYRLPPDDDPDSDSLSLDLNLFPTVGGMMESEREMLTPPSLLDLDVMTPPPGVELVDASYDSLSIPTGSPGERSEYSQVVDAMLESGMQQPHTVKAEDERRDATFPLVDHPEKPDPKADLSDTDVSGSLPATPGPRAQRRMIEAQ